MDKTNENNPAGPLENWLMNFREAELRRRLAESQTRSSEQVIVLMDLVATSADTSEAERALMDTMDELVRLREE